MSAEDETFDIDLYGDEPEGEDLAHREDQHDTQDDTHATRDSTATVQHSQNGSQELTDDGGQQSQVKSINTASTQSNSEASTTQSSSQGVKRKATDDAGENAAPQQHDERPLDQGAQVSLKLTELQWWTTEEDLRYFCAQSNTEAELVEIAFGEHKQNGKSKGEAYLEFTSPQAAGMAKRQIEKANAEVEVGGKTNVVGKTKISVWYTAPGNPFKVREGQSKKDVSGGKYNQQGAYNNYNRGGFAGGRGRGGYNARGGGQWSNQNANNSNTYNNGMMGGFGNMGFNSFPGMAMNQNAMMSNMMAGAGFNMAAMGMGIPGMMNARGGANMMNRGGWNGGMAQGYQQASFGQGWDSNKKPRKE